MTLSRVGLASVLLVGMLPVVSHVQAQIPGHEQGIPDPIPPPAPKPRPPEDAGNYQPLIPDSDAAWEIDQRLLDVFHEKVELYRDYTKRFTCTELARLADYDGSGAVANERQRNYGYLLTTAAGGDGVVEFRQEVAKNGTLKQGRVEDEEPFPPAYAWVFLFSRFNEGYFSYRYMGDRFDGFDWIHEVQFKGSLRFTGGKDIREWEGVVLIDAVTNNPIEIRAEPAGQRDRIDALYRRWASSFNLLGMKTAPKPLGYRAQVSFRYKREGLAFPTTLRYDTFRAVSPSQIVPAKASSREYKDYRIFTIQDQQAIEEPVGSN